MYDEAWWRSKSAVVKRRLTKLEGLYKMQPEYVLAETARIRRLMDEHGYPDWWARIDRLERDAEAYSERGAWNR